MKIVFICSTNASVVKRALETSLLNSYSIEFVSDRECGAITFAKENNYCCTVLESSTGSSFSKKLVKRYKANQDILFVSFYTRLLTAPFLNDHKGRLINFHPSILPACPGMDGFGDTLNSGSLFVGSTVHFIDQGIDTGVPLLQAAYPRSPAEDITSLRHRIFLQQTISLIQVVKWFNDKRVKGSESGSLIERADYQISEFSPNLDSNLQVLFASWLEESY
ncbi:phosphoribosylglycinamide formyltransferase [Vibrio cyclitrophicus]